MKAGEFEMFLDEAGEYRFRFTVQGVTILHSKGYRAKPGCTRGIYLARAQSRNPDNFVIHSLINRKYYFKLLSASGATVGFSSRCETLCACEHVATTVQALASGAMISHRSSTARRAALPLAYRIYAVPLDDISKAYCPVDAKTLLGEGFETAQARDNWWGNDVVPDSVSAPCAGACDYKYQKWNRTAVGAWEPVDRPRYSNRVLIDGNVARFRGETSVTRVARGQR